MQMEIETTFCVSLDGEPLGDVSFLSNYEPQFQMFGDYGAVWGGLDLYVIDRRGRTMKWIEREDETHRVHPCGLQWCVQGELSIDLFDPQTSAVLATYSHNEVITDSWIDGPLFCLRDFENRTLCLDPRNGLRPVTTGPAATSP